MIAVVVGTRPEIIKMAPVIQEAERQGIEVFFVHSGQHYSPDMDGIFFEDLRLRAPDVNLEVGSGTHAQTLSRIMERLEPVLAGLDNPTVLVHGDTNTTAAAAIVASRLGLRTGHVEAGLRSYDRTMPEEHNRVIADHICDMLFAPTEGAADNLRKEGIPEERIFVTGNTIVDAVEQNLPRAKTRELPFGLQASTYILLTAHRQENVDHPERFAGILEGARLAGKDLGARVIYPIHPRSRGKLDGQDVSGIELVDPLGYLDFLNLLAHARIVMTDSGGLQEETCILGVPCLTLRDNTERPETLTTGGNVLVGTEPQKILLQTRAAKSLPSPMPPGAAHLILELSNSHSELETK